MMSEAGETHSGMGPGDARGGGGEGSCVVEVLSLVQYLCEGHYMAMQHLMRKQVAVLPLPSLSNRSLEPPCGALCTKLWHSCS